MKMPLQYRWLVANGFDGFVPWFILDDSSMIDGIDALRKEFKKETGDDFFPFAKRQDCDDVAGFKIIKGEITSVVINIHLTWSGKKESTGDVRISEYPDMFCWLKEKALIDTSEWMSEEDLEDILEES